MRAFLWIQICTSFIHQSELSAFSGVLKIKRWNSNYNTSPTNRTFSSIKIMKQCLFIKTNNQNENQYKSLLSSHSIRAHYDMLDWILSAMTFHWNFFYAKWQFERRQTQPNIYHSWSIYRFEVDAIHSCKWHVSDWNWFLLIHHAMLCTTLSNDTTFGIFSVLLKCAPNCP